MNIPQEAIDAAMAAREEALRNPPAPELRSYGYLTRLMVEAAAPLIAAVERARIRQLAQQRFDLLHAADYSQAAQTLADVLIITGDDT